MRFLGFAAACAVALASFTAPSAAEEAPPPAPAESQASAQQPVAAPTQEAPAENPDEVICKRLEAETGTRLGKRKECHTRREWDQIAEESKQALEDARTKN